MFGLLGVEAESLGQHLLSLLQAHETVLVLVILLELTVDLVTAVTSHTCTHAAAFSLAGLYIIHIDAL